MLQTKTPPSAAGSTPPDHGGSAIDHALVQLREAYVRANPASRAQYERALAVMPGGNTRSVLFYDPFPLAIARGDGCRLFDADGHAYTDFLAEFTAGLFGHSHPVIRAAIDRALDGGINLSGHNLLESRLAGLVRERFPSIESLRFTNSGTEANLMAIAAAQAHTGRRKVVVFDGSYHGGVLSFAGGNEAANVPHDFLRARYNDLEGTCKLLRQAAADVAAVVVEPMQGAGGCIPGDPEFLAMLRAETLAAGSVLVFDEVMTSRLSPGGRQAQLGIGPDLTTLGKYIGGGMSFGAFGGRREILDLFDPRRANALGHAGTFNNNVLSMSAGIAGLEQVYTPEIALALNARGERLRERLNANCRRERVALQFTGLGSLMNLHPTAQPVRRTEDLRGCDRRVRDLFFFFMLSRDIYVARRGFVVLSLPVETAHLEAFAAAFEAFVATYGDLLRA